MRKKDKDKEGTQGPCTAGAGDKGEIKGGRDTIGQQDSSPFLHLSPGYHATQAQ